MGAVGGYAVRMVSEGQQRRNVTVGDEPDITAITAVAAIGAAEGYVGFTAERDTARATVASSEAYVTFINEIGH